MRILPRPALPAATVTSAMGVVRAMGAVGLKNAAGDDLDEAEFQAACPGCHGATRHALLRCATRL